jgi:hypothetical protein
LSNLYRTVGFFKSELDINPKARDRTAAHLRKAGMAPPRKRGPAPDITTTAAVDEMTGSILAPSNSKVVETVRSLRTQPLTSVHFNPLSADTPPDGRVRAAFNSVQALGIDLIDRHSAAAMLDKIIDAMRSGTFAKWSENDDDVIVEFYPARIGAVIYFDRSDINQSAVFAFDVAKTAPPPPVQHVIRVRGSVLRGLATALGPLSETVIPPPPY